MEGVTESNALQLEGVASGAKGCDPLMFNDVIAESNKPDFIDIGAISS